SAGRYSLVAPQLATPFAKDISNTSIGNRLAYSHVKMGRYAEARAFLSDLNKKNAMDGYSYALLSVIETEAGNRAASEEAMKEAVLSDGENIGVRTAQAYIALKNQNTSVLGKLSQDLAKEQSQRTEVNYFLSAFTNKLQQFDQSRKYFERAVLIEPANVDMYVERGNESIHTALFGGLEKKDSDLQLTNAKIMYETALLAQPSSHLALTGLSIIALLQNNVRDAVKFGEAAVASNKNYAGGYYALSAAYSEASKTAEAGQKSKIIGESQKANVNAGLLDKPNLEGREIPNARAAFRYFETAGRTLVMSAPK
ncbi:MAG: hypothetical protein H7Y17_06595, partial [Chlorobia bacterium]|nr:hypothetical protein [Fimbriimonadaceae bacterium]